MTNKIYCTIVCSQKVGKIFLLLKMANMVPICKRRNRGESLICRSVSLTSVVIKLCNNSERQIHAVSGRDKYFNGMSVCIYMWETLYLFEFLSFCTGINYVVQERGTSVDFTYLDLEKV